MTKEQIKELAGKILTDLNDAQYEIHIAQMVINQQAQRDKNVADLEFNDFFQDLNTTDEELDKIIKRLEPYDE